MLKDIWSNSLYHKKIAEWDDLTHPGLKEIFEKTKGLDKVLDVGCGDGTKLSKMGGVKKTGTEVSKETVAAARKKYPGIKFVLAFGENLPFKDNEFDAVTSTFVLEHTKNPQEVIDEIIRVTKKGGKFYLLAPNFGAPNRASPNFEGSRLIKLLSGFILDFCKVRPCNWRRVKPKLSDISQFEPDLDTTVEPYLGSLIQYLNLKKIKIIKSTSFWEMELSTARPVQRLFKFFKKNWGPHLFVIGEKI